MRIIRLEASNIKRLTAVDITPNKGLTIIAGRNGQGKTSTLDAIEYALGGKPGDPRPLREGEASGHTTVTMDTGLVVRRTLTERGTTLTVTSAEGFRASKPQGHLDALVGALSFDPLAFGRLKPKEQMASLQELVGLDCTDIDATRKAAYSDRKAANAEAKRLKGHRDSLPDVPPGTPAEPVSVAALMQAHEDGRDTNNQHRRERLDLAREVEREPYVLQRIQDLRDELARQEALLEHVIAKRKQLTPLCDALVDIDTAELEAQIRGAEGVNAAVRLRAQHKAAADDVASAIARADALTAKINDCDTERRARVAACELPVDGLSLDGSGVTFMGRPLEQASAAERLRVSVAMGLAANPKLRLLLIRDGSLLDADSLRMVGEMAEAAGADIWIERVGTGDAGAIVIEDGAVVEVSP